MQKEAMEFDVVIVGAGPAGLSAACRLMQQAKAAQQELSVCVVEKGSEVGAHIISGAVFDPKALTELFPDWQPLGAPLSTQVSEDHIYFLKDESSSISLPHWLAPNTMLNQGNYIVSMGNVCRWLAEQAELLGVEIFPGFSATEVLFAENRVAGVITGDMGRAADGSEKPGFMQGMELRARYTLFAEGSRGHLGKQLIQHYQLDANSTPQHYAIGFKEIWDIDPELHQPGLVVHSAGWPLNDASGGGFLYHADNNQVFVGLIVDLNYQNPHLSPFEEFQKLKHHPVFSQYLNKAKRVAYGARAITKGGFFSLPKMTMPGAILIGCDAGTLNFSKIKGNHTAMKSGMLAAETIFSAINTYSESGHLDLETFDQRLKSSWLYKELYQSRNFGGAIHKYGTLFGGAFNSIEQNIFPSNKWINIKDDLADYQQLKSTLDCPAISYPKPDNLLGFDKLSSVYLSNTNHEENQPCHLQLKDPEIPVKVNLEKYLEPAQRYCPAGVYEVNKDENEKPVFVINSQNCIHCKTCDIKDPSQNINWVPPEGGGGPNYPNM